MQQLPGLRPRNRPAQQGDRKDRLGGVQGLSGRHLGAIFQPLLLLGAGLGNSNLAGETLLPVDLHAAPIEAAPTCAVSAFASNWITQTPPASGSRRIVILGSSSAAGLGASRYDLSWVGLLTPELHNRGFEVVNSSISGSGTSTSLARFDTDVAPHQPDFVVLATSIFNEGFVSAPQPALNRYIINTRELIRKTRELGAIPIVVGMYPSDFYNSTNISLISQLYRTEETLGVPVWDFWSIVSDQAGNWLPGLTRDGLHPTDVGHSYFFNSIPISLFDVAYSAPHVDLATVPGSWRTPQPAEGQDHGRIDIRLDRPSDSWTSAAWIQDSGVDAWQVYLRFGSDKGERFRLERHGPELVLREAEDETLRAPLTVGSERSWHHVAVSYQFATRKLQVLLDGSVAGELQTSQVEPMSYFEYGSGCSGCSFSDLVAYRTNLDMDQVALIKSGLIPRRSLEFWAPLRQSTMDSLNLARTNPSLTITGSWQYQAGESPASCSLEPTQQSTGIQGSMPRASSAFH
ncbi:GDSL-type esterase/lipase family protein [Paludibaculum fermentans]|uniref:GDSL-type esterase/lipase family protein n=1 Tax=Paludibaculum fermentans TaxID=1473598 RepID=UPI003EBFB4C6